MRLEVKKAKNEAIRLERLLEETIKASEDTLRLWTEFNPDLVSISDVKLSVKKIAGVKTPILDEVEFEVKPYSLFKSPSWFPDGIEIIKELVKISLESAVYNRKMELLDFARKKTTQKVNLYEKVQIPGYEEAILKIKRFLEDEENLSKASQKIVKSRMEEKQMEAVA